MYISSQRSWASLRKSRWRLGPCGCFSSACRRMEQDFPPFLQRCCEGKGKAAYGRHGSGALRIDFQKCMTTLSWRSRSSPTAEKVSSLTHVIIHVQSLGFVDCLPWVPWNFAQLSLVQRPENRWLCPTLTWELQSNNGMCACVRAQTTS